ncbi:hypothetical protein L1987_01588 [Smallanthus sonchifolius]|uniref:Uncharacterized protein n=1 Tax=Smallanthus sonchifolius TaxID=185202 RepID=A0ACB9K5G6_9ASTR|nr:hypothetical protein L1987_01588 [Smallanthus sonchifolius]
MELRGVFSMVKRLCPPVAWNFRLPQWEATVATNLLSREITPSLFRTHLMRGERVPTLSEEGVKGRWMGCGFGEEGVDLIANLGCENDHRITS